MHAAWEKRAYEAEAALLAGAVPAAAPLRAQRDALLDALKAIAENGIDSNHYANRTARAAIAKAVGAVPAAPLDQADDDPNVVMAVTAIVREADQEFQRVGGSSRHWVRECFLPVLNRCGWQVVRAQAVPEECR